MLAELRGLNEECGVFGIWGNPNPAHLSYYGLHALQHRGQEGAGIVVSDGQHLRAVKGEGLVNDVFNEDKLKAVDGKAAIATFDTQLLVVAVSKMFSHYYSIHQLVAFQLLITVT